MVGPPRVPERASPLRYPPSDPGIALESVEEIVAAQIELISRIYRTLGITPEQFAERVNPMIANLARHVHLLPATGTGHHRGLGGLFRLCLEMALYSLQGANSAVFPISGGTERRYALQPKWILASMTAGMCSQLHRSLTAMTVLGESGVRWQPLLQPLYDWAQTEGIDRYFVRWLTARDASAAGAQATSAFLVGHVCPAEVIQWLAEDNAEVIPAMTAAIAGADEDANPIARIIGPLLPRLVERDLANAAEHYGKLSVGFQLEPHLIDAMRRLVRDGSWTCNQPGAALWIGAEGAFIDWESAAQQVVGLLVHDNLAGVPRDPESLARILTEAGVFAPPRTGDTLYWTLEPARQSCRIPGAVKLEHPRLVLGETFDSTGFAAIRLGTTPVRSSGSPAEQQVSPASVAPPAESSQAKPKQAGPAAETAAQQSLPLEAATKPAAESADAAQAGTEPAPAAGNNGDALLSKLKEEHAWLLRQILARALASDLAEPILSMPSGVAIATDEIKAHGHPSSEFIGALKEAKWLWFDMTRPMRTTHTVTHGGRNWKAVILRRDIAAELGLEAVATPIEAD